MVTFRLYCPTKFGQNLYIKIGSEMHAMSYYNNAVWTAELELPKSKAIRYQYVLVNADDTQVLDSPKYRYLPAHEGDIEVEDAFGYREVRSVFETKAFTECLMRQKDEKALPRLKKGEVLLMLNAPGVLPEQGVAMLGNQEFLGNWDESRKVALTPSVGGWWWMKLPADAYLTHAEYKFVIYDRATNAVVKWELGENRRMPLVSGSKVFSNSIRIDYNWHGTGVAIPVFSLRSKKGWGVGEFLDLKRMADWAIARGQKLIQILPINDTTSTHTDLDSYPYRANSVYALHPMYLNMEALGKLDSSSKMKEYRAKAKELNELSAINYSAVNELKWNYIRDIFAEKYDEIVADKAFKSFVKDNAHWLKDYAVFSCLRDSFGTDNYAKWGEYAEYTEAKREAFIKKNKKAVELYYFIQFSLDAQLCEAIKYLHSKGVVVKGDLPIGISATSVDAWVNPRLFNLDKQAGAPPDDFSVTGQNWGFPTYNWAEMAKDKYAWWMSRFENMGRYFDAFRIDHILGFFRIWEIPTDCVWGLLGYFNPSMPLSVSEIEHYGFWFDRDRYTIPYVTKHNLYNLFAGDTEEIIGAYFNNRSYDRYVFKPEYDTQRKLEDSFVRNGLLPKHADILDKLLSLYCEVIFIEDRANAGYYHPRINVMKSQSFAELSDHEKWCIQRIHDEYFYHRHTNQWSSEAMRKLPALLNTTDMLVCGEDLGMVPACVPDVMNQLQILSLEVQRMPKETTQRYVNLDAVPYLSVCCTGTHDTSPVRMWWRENRENTQWFYNNVLHQDGVAPEDLSPELAQQIVDMHVNSKSMWAILPWQDYMACDGANRFPNPDAERINDPSNPRHIWCWRMHVELGNKE